MNSTAVRQALLALTVVYGLLIALLAVLDVAALGLVASAGAVLIGLGWGLAGRPTRRGPQG
ncbi:hypothetical protein LUW76_41015 [Actinomadura madurae]|uniref:hypothetical protein n=1 Tax=Actinomadura madurae TaxID=1993 RepID=UPI002026073B|nr:hypothetical protein [Actinomadura madurae]URN00187.1 hypothetical protein LUW76_41015 [Actinomadura madurae]URN02346.1 hypothetical protein LUW74_02445 [Actinomadura madurae]